MGGGSGETGRALAKNIHKNKDTVLYPLINYEIMCARAKGMVSFTLMSNPPPPPSPSPLPSLQGEYTLGRATKAALCLWASKPQCCFYEPWLGEVRLGHLVLVLLTHKHTNTPTHTHTTNALFFFLFSRECRLKTGWV